MCSSVITLRREFVFLSHEQKFKKERELAAAAEKLRREKWIEEKTKKIKAQSQFTAKNSTLLNTT